MKTICRKTNKNAGYPFEEISRFLCEVGWQVQLALQDFINRLFSVFTCERWLRREAKKKKAISNTVKLQAITLGWSVWRVRDPPLP